MNPNYALKVREDLDKLLDIGFIYPILSGIALLITYNNSSLQSESSHEHSEVSVLMIKKAKTRLKLQFFNPEKNKDYQTT